MRKKINKNIVLIAAVIIIIILSALYTLFIVPNMSKTEIVYKENKADFGNLQNGVTESGSLELGLFSQTYELDVTTEEDDDETEDEQEKYLKVQEIYVAVGQRIKKGDAVYRFTEDSINDVRKSLTYAKTEAQIALSEAQTEYNIGVLEAGLSHNETMLDSSLAQATYDNTIASLSNDMAIKSLEIEKLLDEIYELQLELVDEEYIEQKEEITEAYEDATKALEDASDKFVTNRVSAVESFQSAKESYESFFEQFNNSNDSIQQKIDEVLSIQEEMYLEQQLWEKELMSAKQEYETSKISGSIADTKYNSKLSSYEVSLNKAKDDLEEATKKLEAYNEFVGDGIVYAQESGIVTEIGYEVDEYLVSEGILISYATSDDMTITVDVSQEDVTTIAVGDSVDVKFKAYDEDVYEGIVESITTTSTSQSSATVSYPVVISIKGDTSKLYGGMTADVTFVLEEKKDVVYVPRKAIVEEHGQKYVYKKINDEYVLSPVETGFTNGIDIEIVSGLEDGETYYIASVLIEENEEEDKNNDKKSDKNKELKDGKNDSIMQFPMQNGNPGAFENMPQDMPFGDFNRAPNNRGDR